MAGWEGEANWNCDVLERIVALLFALANLADLAAGLPLHRRRHVLGILSHGDAEARAFLFGGAPMPTDALEQAGDATRLAVRLRTLALVLCALLAQAARFAPSGADHPQAGRSSDGNSRPVFRWRNVPAQPAPDTS